VALAGTAMTWVMFPAEGCVGYLDVDAGVAMSRAGDGGVADAVTWDGPCSYGAYACTILEARPILYLRFDEDSGVTTASDLTAHGYDGTYSTYGLVLGVPGALHGDPDPAVRFTGTGRIAMPKPLSADFTGPNPKFSVEFWINPDADGGGVQPDAASVAFLLDHETVSPSPRGGWTVLLQQSDPSMQYWADGGTLGVAFMPPGTALTTGQWHHVVGVCDVSEQNLWIDGQRQMSHGGSLNSPLAAVGSWMIGNQNCNPCDPQGFSGSFDELSIYDRVLSEADIVDHYNKATR
jgi:hypothetical protein